MPVTDPYLGTRTLMRAFLDAALPRGAAWQPKPGGDLDHLLDGIGDSAQFVHDALADLARVRDPWTTPLLDELEREFGVTPNVQLTDSQRRATLALVKYARDRRGTPDNLQNALDQAGFGAGGLGLQVYPNDPAIDPAPYMEYAFLTMAGEADALCGYTPSGGTEITAICGVSGGLWVVNGDVFEVSPNYLGCGDPAMLCGYMPSGSTTKTALCGIYYSLSYLPVPVLSPADPGSWPLVFFVAKEGMQYTNWTAQNIPAGFYSSVAWNGSLWCAVGYSGNLCATSPDGITWTAQAGIPSHMWTCVAWNGSLWCAVANGTVCATSPDGVTWTSRTIPSGAWNSIAWNGSLFCAVGTNGTDCATSPDGITWTSRTIPVGSWNAVAWNGSLWCAVGQGGTNFCATSPDGVTWTAQPGMPSGAWNSIAWNGSLFCAVGGNVCATSPDGITWTARSIPEGYWNSVVWSGSLWCTVSSGGGNLCVTSVNASDWRTYSVPSGAWNSIAGNDSLLCMVAGEGANLCAVWGIPTLAMAQTPANQRAVLVELILRWKPIYTWAALLVTFS